MALSEQDNASRLNLAKNILGPNNKKINTREVIKRANSNRDPEDESQDENVHRRNLSLLKAAAGLDSQELVRKGDKALGGLIGGFVGSEIPIIGSAIGAWIGRKFGASKMLVASIITITLSFIMTILIIVFMAVIFISVLKYSCDTWTGWAADKMTYNFCQSLGLLTNTK